MSPSQPACAEASETRPGGLSPEDFAKYRGYWLAFSPDGGRLIAGCKTLKELDEQVKAAGENPEDVLLQQIPGGDSVVSGSELS